LVSALATNAAELVPLGFLYPNDAGRHSYVNSVSADGAVAVGFSDSLSSNKQAFRWTQQSGMIGLGYLETDANRGSEALAASCDGSVIVGFASSPLGFQAFRWTQQTGMQPLGFLNLGAPFSIATSVSCDGSVVVGYSSGALGEEALTKTADAFSMACRIAGETDRRHAARANRSTHPAEGASAGSFRPAGSKQRRLRVASFVREENERQSLARIAEAEDAPSCNRITQSNFRLQ
jgi:probable HAF family extracellular repeat protein